MDLGQALLQHLELAVEAFGADLPLAGVRRAAAVSAPAAAAEPAAPEPPTARPQTPRRSAPRHQTPSRPAAAPEPREPTAGEAPDLETLAASLANCQKCKLARGRTHVVFGEGAPDARVMFIGEAPGFHEDQQSRPFVGPAGQLLDRIIENAMGLRRADVYIANVNKCRPPGNRDPEPDEVAACLPHLREQVRLIRPEVIVTLGRVAAQNLLASHLSMGRLRGKQLYYEGIPVVATWHPAYLLRQPSAKAQTWEDIKRVNRLLGNPEVPEPRRG